MATKDKVYTVREGYKFQAIEDGGRVDKRGGETVKNLTDDQLAAFGDIFEETYYGGSKTSYRSDTPDGNPDTTAVVTQGLPDGRVAAPTIGPAEAGQSPPVPPNKEQAPIEAVAPIVQGEGNSVNSESSGVQAVESEEGAVPRTMNEATSPATPAPSPSAPAPAPKEPAPEVKPVTPAPTPTPTPVVASPPAATK